MTEPRQNPAGTGILVLFGSALFLSALLLFAVQPMFTKMVLPMLGGSPGVWNTAMLFFQTVLLAGYAYAHLSSRMIGLRPQVILHLFVMGAAFGALPIAVAAGWTPPPGDAPVYWLIGLFAVSVGLPFFAVSANAPLLQKWFAHTGHHSSDDPYFLYGASNLGSILALLAYPVVIEPVLRLQEQSLWWMVGFGFLIVAIAFCGGALWRYRGADQSDAAAVATKPPLAAEPVTWRRRLHWLVLAFAPSSLLLGVTAHITTDVASVPLLWVIPLALYLLTFVIVFARRPWLRQAWMVKAQPFVVIPITFLFWWNLRIPLLFVSLHLLVFFVTAMVCHGELVRRRPAADRLTEFYLWISFGGMLGGVFNVIIAPLVFNSIHEFPIALILACMLRPVLGDDGASMWRRDILFPFVLFAVFIIPPLFFDFRLVDLRLGEAGMYGAVFFFVPLGVMAYSFRLRPLRFGLGIAAILVVTALTTTEDTVIARERSFFGVHKVQVSKSGAFNVLMHGTTVHGAQSTDPAKWQDPLTYFQTAGPIGQLFDALAAARNIETVGVLGLGAGTIVCYRRPGQSWTYFEIDPVVERLARDTRYFRYLAACGGDTKVVLGDGRLSLEKITDGHFDLLIMDAFSSDSVPIHLITREALALYMRTLKANGVLVFNISNRNMDFSRVLGNLARDAGLVGRFQHYVSGNLDYRKTYKVDSIWVVIA
jgi:predicted methyltransferase